MQVSSVDLLLSLKISFCFFGYRMDFFGIYQITESTYFRRVFRMLSKNLWWSLFVKINKGGIFAKKLHHSYLILSSMHLRFSLQNYNHKVLLNIFCKWSFRMTEWGNNTALLADLKPYCLAYFFNKELLYSTGYLAKGQHKRLSASQ